MIFAPENCELILKGIKTRTRRQRLPSDMAVDVYDMTGWNGAMKEVAGDCEFLLVRRNGRLLWEVGRTYAMKPGRTKKSVGRILLLGIRSEKVGDITKEDAIDEGARLWSPEFGGTILGGERQYIFTVKGKSFTDADPRVAYLKGWKDFYEKSDFTELVWVLTFRRAP